MAAFETKVSSTVACVAALDCNVAMAALAAVTLALTASILPTLIEPITAFAAAMLACNAVIKLA